MYVRDYFDQSIDRQNQDQIFLLVVINPKDLRHPKKHNEIGLLHLFSSPAFSALYAAFFQLYPLLKWNRRYRSMLGCEIETRLKLKHQNFENFGLELLVEIKHQHLGGFRVLRWARKTVLYLSRLQSTQINSFQNVPRLRWLSPIVLKLSEVLELVDISI